MKAFLAGGDDYIVKPFSLLELEARVAAHLRREQRSAASSLVKFTDSLVIDYGKRNVFSANRELPLVKKDFAIISLLSQNPRQIFNWERIYERVWGYDAEGSSTLLEAGFEVSELTRCSGSLEEHFKNITGGVGIA